MIDDETLRAAFTSSLVDARPADSCPEPEKLWDGLSGKLPPDELRDLVDHTASCAACAEAWRIGVALEGDLAREASAPVDAPAAARKTARARRPPLAAWWRYAAAAAVVVGAVGIARLGDQTVPGEQHYRTATTPTIVSLVADDTPLPAEAFVLRWRLEAPGKVERYEILVMTDDLRLVAQDQDLASPSYQVPESDLAALAPGTLIRWRVEAVRAEGGRVQSETFTVRLQ